MASIKLQEMFKKHDASNHLTQMDLLRSCDRKAKNTNKIGFYNQIKDEHEIDKIAEPKLKKYQLSKAKEMQRNNSPIQNADGCLYPLIVLHHQKKKNLKKNSDKIFAHYEKPSTKFKLSSERLINLRQSVQAGDNLDKVNKLHRRGDKILLVKSPLQYTLKSVEKEMLGKNNIKNIRYKHKRMRDRGLVCNNSLAKLEAMRKKKRSIINKHIFKKDFAMESNILTDDMKNKIKFQIIKVDEKHELLIIPSQIENLLKYKNDPNKHKSSHDDTIKDKLRTKLTILNGAKNIKNKHEKINLENRKLSTRLSEIVIIKKDKLQYNPTLSESIPLYRNKNSFKKIKRNKGNNVNENNSYSMRENKRLKTLLSKNKCCKENEIKEGENYIATQTAKFHDVEYGKIYGQNPQFATIFSESLTVKHNQKKNTDFESSKTLCTNTAAGETTVNQEKCDKSYPLKHEQKKYKLKELFRNRKLTHPYCTLPLPIKYSSSEEFKEKYNTSKSPKVNLNSIESSSNSPPQKDQIVYFYTSKHSPNDIRFWPKSKNRLNSINANKNILKIACSNKQLMENELKEEKSIEKLTNENMSSSVFPSNSNKSKENKGIFTCTKRLNIVRSNKNLPENECKKNNNIAVGTNENTPESVDSSNSDKNQGKDQLFIYTQKVEWAKKKRVKKIKDTFAEASPIVKDQIMFSNKHDTNNDDVFNITETNKDNSSSKSLSKLAKKYEVSEVGVQTDTLETVEFSEKVGKIRKYPTSVNESFFFKHETKTPFHRKSFVHITVDENAVKTDNYSVEYKHFSSNDGNNLDNNHDVLSNRFPEKDKTDLNSEISHFVANESNEDKTQIINKINAVYEFLQKLDQILKNNGVVKCQESSESTNATVQFNNLLHCLCNNCLDILNKIESDPSGDECKRFMNNSKSIESSHFLSVANTVSTRRNKFLKIIEDDSSKIENRKQLNQDIIKKVPSSFSSLSKRLIPTLNTRSKTEINSNDIPVKILQSESPNVHIMHQFYNKAGGDHKDIFSCTHSNNNGHHKKILDPVLHSNMNSTSKDKHLLFVKKIEIDTPFKTQLRSEGIQDKRQPFVNHITDNIYLNNDSKAKCCDDGISGNWFGPVTPPAEKRRLFIQMVHEDSDNVFDTHQEPEKEPCNVLVSSPKISKQNLINCKSEREAFVVIVPSSHTISETVKGPNEKKDNFHRAEFQHKEVLDSSDLKDEYFDSLLLERKICNSKAQDVWWHDKYERRECNKKKFSHNWESSKTINQSKQKSSNDKKISTNHTTEGRIKSFSDNKFPSVRNPLAYGKQFLKHLYSESLGSLIRPKAAIHNYLDIERKLPDCCLCFKSNESVCQLQRIKCSHKQNMNTSPGEKHSSGIKVRHITNNKSHIESCWLPQNNKFKYKTKLSNNLIEGQKYDETDIGCNLRNECSYIDTSRLNNIENEHFTNKRQPYYNDLNTFKDDEDCKIFQSNVTQPTVVVPNMIGNSKYYIEDNLFKNNNSNNYKYIAYQSSDTSTQYSSESNLNSEILKKNVTFINNKLNLGSKAIYKNSKQCNPNSSIPKLKLLNTQQNSNLDKMYSSETSIFHTKSKTKPVKKCINNKKQKLLLNGKQNESIISFSSFCCTNKSKTFSNQSISLVEGTQFKNNTNKLNTGHSDSFKENRNDVSIENLEIRNELGDEWISLNNCDFQKVSVSNKEEIDTKENKIAFKMNIQMSDMHVHFICQPPDLNSVDETQSVNKIAGNF